MEPPSERPKRKMERAIVLSGSNESNTDVQFEVAIVADRANFQLSDQQLLDVMDIGIRAMKQHLKQKYHFEEREVPLVDSKNFFSDRPGCVLKK